VADSCITGKKQYANGADAHREARKMRRQIKGATALRPYFCGHCGQYHLGNPSSSRSSGHMNRTRRKRLRKRVSAGH